MFKKIIYQLFLGIILLTTTIIANATLPVIDIASLAQLSHQLTLLKQSTQYIKQSLQGLPIAQFQWSNVQNLIDHLGSTISQVNGIAYSAANISQRFSQVYPGYQVPQDFYQQYKNIANTTQQTLNGLLQSIGDSAQHFKKENRQLAMLQQEVQKVSSQTQAIQASAQIASEVVSQIQLLRQTVMAQTNAQLVYYAAKIQNDIDEKAAFEKIIHTGSIDISLYGTSGHVLNTPAFNPQ
jgi:P-type conjugative transfer protein TrbJ